MINKRVYSIDLLRVISMIMVIVFHVANAYSRLFGKISNESYLISLIFSTIARMSVPIFFMISGALLLDRDFEKSKYWHRIGKMVLTVYIWDIIYLLWDYYFLGRTYSNLWRLLIMPYKTHLWFLYVITVLYVIQPILKKAMKKCNKTAKITLLSLWVIIAIISLFSKFLNYALSIFCYIGYFIIGRYLYLYLKKKKNKIHNVIFISSILFCLTISVLLNYYFSIKYNMFVYIYQTFSSLFVGISSVLFYSLIIKNYHENNSALLNLSSLSFGIYLIHALFIDITKKLFVYKLFNPIIGIPTFSLIVFLSSYISAFIIKRIKGIKSIA